MHNTLALIASCTLFNCAQQDGQRERNASVDAGPMRGIALDSVAAGTTTPLTTANAAPPPGTAESSASSLQPVPAPAPLPEATRLRSVRAIGHTSVVLKLSYADGVRAAFKPASRRGGSRYQGEIAGYLLAEALGLHGRVPPARSYDIGLAPLIAAADLATQQLIQAELAGVRLASPAAPAPGVVRGAWIGWVDNLTFPALERPPALTKWKRLLDHTTQVAQLTPSDAELAAAMSALCTFDYLSGNFDRFSGGNIGMADERLLFIDNDGAFLVPQPAAAARANLAQLLAIDHHSKNLVTRIEALTDPQLWQLLGANSEAQLGAPQVAAVAVRRREFLRIITQKRTTFGDAVVFAFP